VPWGTWQRWSPSEQGGEIWRHGTRGSAGALLCREARSGVAGHGSARALLSREAGSGAMGHMAVPEPS
jgi:hypothetical protein